MNRMNEFISGLVYDRETDLYTHPAVPGVTFDGIAAALDYFRDMPENNLNLPLAIPRLKW